MFKGVEIHHTNKEIKTRKMEEWKGECKAHFSSLIGSVYKIYGRSKNKSIRILAWDSFQSCRLNTVQSNYHFRWNNVAFTLLVVLIVNKALLICRLLQAN